MRHRDDEIATGPNKMKNLLSQNDDWVVKVFEGLHAKNEIERAQAAWRIFIFDVTLVRLDTTSANDLDERGRDIDANDLISKALQIKGHVTVCASDVKNALARAEDATNPQCPCIGRCGQVHQPRADFIVDSLDRA